MIDFEAFLSRFIAGLFDFNACVPFYQETPLSLSHFFLAVGQLGSGTE